MTLMPDLIGSLCCGLREAQEVIYLGLYHFLYERMFNTMTHLFYQSAGCHHLELRILICLQSMAG